jgi:hypothetical protein
MVYPDWKYRLALKHLKEGTEASNLDVKNLLSVLKGTCSNPTAIEVTLEARDIYEDKGMVKEIIESCFLCEDYTMVDVQAITGMNIDLIEVYRLFFFDPNVFKYRLLRYDYVRGYKNLEFPDGMLYKKWAISTGIKFLRWHFGIDTDIVPRKALSNLIGDTFFRAKEHINESITGPTAKESLKWMKMSLDALVQLNDIDMKDTSNTRNVQDQIRIALEYKDRTKKADDISDAEIVR